MSTILFEMPDERTELPRWLEQQLVGRDLAQLIRELSAIRSPSQIQAAAQNSVTLNDLLGSQRADVLTKGLSPIAGEKIHQLLVRPELLLDLQDLIFSEGGDYWKNVARPKDLQKRVPPANDILQKIAPDSQRVATVSRKESNVRQKPILSWLVTAAAVLIAAYLGYDRFKRVADAPVAVAATTNWIDPANLAKLNSRQDYFKELAAQATKANAWFEKHSDNKIELSRGINEFRQGCSLLMLTEQDAKHNVITPQDREWLLEKCRLWADKLDTQLVALEKGRGLKSVSTATRDIISNLSKALSTRAEADGTVKG